MHKNQSKFNNFDLYMYWKMIRTLCWIKTGHKWFEFRTRLPKAPAALALVLSSSSVSNNYSFFWHWSHRNWTNAYECAGSNDKKIQSLSKQNFPFWILREALAPRQLVHHTINLSGKPHCRPRKLPTCERYHLDHDTTALAACKFSFAGSPCRKNPNGARGCLQVCTPQRGRGDRDFVVF